MKHTSKFPRTLSEAFGPYTSQTIEDTDNGASTGSWLVWIAVAVIFVLLVVVISTSAPAV